MGIPRFYLKKPEKNGQALIYLQFKYNREKLVYTFGVTIRPENWDEKGQRPKVKKATTADGKHLLADTLAELAKVCTKSYNELLPNGIPTPEMIKVRLEDWRQKHFEAEKLEAKAKAEAKANDLMALIDRFINGEIKYKGQNKAANTLKTYTTTKHHLEGYATYTKQPLDFDTITLDFYYKWVDYLQSKARLNVNAIGKAVQILKVFMSEAVDLGYTNNMAFKHKKFVATRIDTDAVYLNEAEIMAFYQFDFAGNTRLEAVRDLFVFGCMVGLRYSDYSNVKPQNIIEVDGEKVIYIRTKKTSEVVYIPCNPVVLDIFSKYQNNPNKLPKALSEQAFNRYIKEAAKAAGLTETGRLLGEPDAALFECIASHTARRSFATNYYLEGFPTIDLMKITGHKTEKSFLRYIKISKLDAAKKMAEHNRRKNWAVIMGGIQAKALKVAS